MTRSAAGRSSMGPTMRSCRRSKPSLKRESVVHWEKETNVRYPREMKNVPI
uniref:Uncharacterized protein n=1 Tax=Ascaris lumbricoides TaxID=6252 RepID=A0A0M3HXQ9_ASCLU